MQAAGPVYFINHGQVKKQQLIQATYRHMPVFIDDTTIALPAGMSASLAYTSPWRAADQDNHHGFGRIQSGCLQSWQ